MKNLIRLVFIAVVVFPNIPCYATREELLELHDEILVPIISHYTDSYTKRMSQAIIKQQKSDKRAMSVGEAFSLYNKLEDTKEFQTAKNKCAPINEIAYCRKCVYAKDENVALTNFSMALKTSWETKVAVCNSYADLVLVALEFNQMNNEKLNKPLNFKRAMLVLTNKNPMDQTGDHGFVLVEASSGAMFAVDPWAGTVEQLDNIPRLSSFNMSNYPDTMPWPGEFNKNLNDLFMVQDGGRSYYDMIYVNGKTTWFLDVYTSGIIQRLVHKYNATMKDFYDAPKSSTDKSPKFRSWEVKYDNLLPQTGTSGKADFEQKTPNNT
jgi:hypothetical protein